MDKNNNLLLPIEYNIPTIFRIYYFRAIIISILLGFQFLFFFILSHPDSIPLSSIFSDSDWDIIRYATLTTILFSAIIYIFLIINLLSKHLNFTLPVENVLKIDDILIISISMPLLFLTVIFFLFFFVIDSLAKVGSYFKFQVTNSHQAKNGHTKS